MPLIALALLAAALCASCARPSSQDALVAAQNYLTQNDTAIRAAMAKWLMNQHHALYDIGEDALADSLIDEITYRYEHPHYRGNRWIPKTTANIDMRIPLAGGGEGYMRASLPIWLHVEIPGGAITLAQPRYAHARFYAEMPALVNDLPLAADAAP